MRLQMLALTVGVLMFAAHSEARHVAPPQDRVGDAYEIRMRLTTAGTSDDGSSSSSRSGGMLIERVVAVRDDGVELEFDLPPDATVEERARDWQWPARVMKSENGPLRLLNGPELETRIDAWLVLSGMTREACGHWIFTWNAFKIECDPQSVIETLSLYDVRVGDLEDGAPLATPGGLGSTVLRIESRGPEGAVMVAETPLDPDVVRRQRADSDVAVGEIMGEPTTVEAALQARADEGIAGTISTRIITDSLGSVTERTTITKIVSEVDGVVERTTTTLTVERRPLAKPGA